MNGIRAGAASLVDRSFGAPQRRTDHATPGVGAFAERILILGDPTCAARIVEAIEANPWPLRVAIGVVDDVDDGAAARVRLPALGSLARLDRILDEARPDAIVVAVRERRGGLPLGSLLAARVRGVRVESAEDFYERVTHSVLIESLTPTAIIHATRIGRPARGEWLARLCSVMVASATLVLLVPLLVLVAAAIRLDSPGPVFFVQERIGRHGRRFGMVKFRTMVAASGRVSEWERDNAARITAVGRWLRRFHVDELPQLLNVLRGDMSLVGPRPLPASNYAMLATVMRNAPERGAAIPLDKIRTLVRPGITGWAQVRFGYANDVREELEKLRYDLYYIKHRSCLFDLRILVTTIATMLFRPRPRPRSVEPRQVPIAGGGWTSLGLN